MKLDILEYIDMIQEQSDFAEMDVMFSLLNTYHKSYMILEQCDPTVQEGFKDDLKAPVLGTKDESTIKRIAMLIPRLIAKLVEIVKRLIQKLKRDDKKVQKLSKDIDDILENAKPLKPEEVQKTSKVDRSLHAESYTIQEQPLPTTVDEKDARYLTSKFSKSNTEHYDKIRTWSPGQGVKISGLYYTDNLSYVAEFNRITKPLWDTFGHTKRMSMSSYRDEKDPKKLRELIDSYLPLTYDGKRINSIVTKRIPQAHDAASGYDDFVKRFSSNTKTYDYTMNAARIKQLKDKLADSTSEKQLLKILEVFEDDLQRMAAITNVKKELMSDHKHWLLDPIGWGQDKADLTQDLENILRQMNRVVASMSSGYVTFRRLREHDLEQIKKSLNSFTS